MKICPEQDLEKNRALFLSKSLMLSSTNALGSHVTGLGFFAGTSRNFAALNVVKVRFHNICLLSICFYRPE